MGNIPSPNSSWANRKLRQDFKRRYNQMSEKERAEFDSDTNNLGCVISGIILLIAIVVIIVRVVFL